MRFWLRLTALIIPLAVLPLVFAGFSATRISFEGAQSALKDSSGRVAENQAEFVGLWLADQVSALRGWMQPFDVGNDRRLTVGLSNAVFLAVPSVQTAVLVDQDGVALSQSFLTVPNPELHRDVGSAERAQQLVDRLPLSEVVAEVAIRSPAETLAIQRPLLEQGVNPTLLERYVSGEVAMSEIVDESGDLREAWRFLRVVKPPAQDWKLGEAYLPVGASTPSVPVAIAAPRSGLVLGAEVSLGPVAELFEQERSHGMALLDQDGVPIIGADHPLVEAEALAPLLGTRSYFSQELPGGRVYGGLAPVPGTGWTVVTVTRADSVEAPARQIQRRVWQIVGLTIGLVLIVSLIVARSLSQPVGELRDAAMRVAEGRYGNQVDLRRSDELGELARAFNHMSERLVENQRKIHSQRKAIEQFNRELQDRVEERTRELRDAQQQLVRSGQLAAVAEVGAGLAHELNNPLSGILGLTQLLRARGPGPETDGLLANIETQAERCRNVVGAMLRFSSGEVASAEQPVIDLNDVLRDVLELVRGPFRQRGVELTLRDPDRQLPVRLDPVHGSRILAQILTTLRAGLEPGSRLEVEGVLAGGRVSVVMRPDRPISASDDWMASGMGLWVAHQLLDQLGGRLSEPEPGGDGAWRVVLPEA